MWREDGILHRSLAKKLNCICCILRHRKGNKCASGCGKYVLRYHAGEFPTAILSGDVSFNAELTAYLKAIGVRGGQMKSTSSSNQYSSLSELLDRTPLPAPPLSIVN